MLCVFFGTSARNNRFRHRGRICEGNPWNSHGQISLFVLSPNPSWYVSSLLKVYSWHLFFDRPCSTPRPLGLTCDKAAVTVDALQQAFSICGLGLTASSFFLFVLSNCFYFFNGKLQLSCHEKILNFQYGQYPYNAFGCGNRVTPSNSTFYNKGPMCLLMLRWSLGSLDDLFSFCRRIWLCCFQTFGKTPSFRHRVESSTKTFLLCLIAILSSLFKIPISSGVFALPNLSATSIISFSRRIG